MNVLSRLRLAPVVLLPVLAAALPLHAAPVHRAHAAAAPVRASAEIIPLPLTPIVPAGQRVCTAKAPTGLGSTVLRPAAGAMPADSDYVLVNYIGYLAATGAVFDQAQHASFPVNGVIPGFSQGLQTLAKGGIARFCIPAALGYGAQASGPIPANADLVFQVELLDFKTAAEIEAMRKAQAADPAAADPATPAPQ